MFVEPRDPPVPEICLINRVENNVIFALIFSVDNFLSQTAQSNKNLIGFKRRNPSIVRAVNDQQWSFDFIEVEDWRVFYVTISEFPWGSSHSPLSLFQTSTLTGR